MVSVIQYNRLFPLKLTKSKYWIMTKRQYILLYDTRTCDKKSSSVEFTDEITEVLSGKNRIFMELYENVLFTTFINMRGPRKLPCGNLLSTRVPAEEYLVPSMFSVLKS